MWVYVIEDSKIAWAAGILEGEGSFMTKTGIWSPKIQCQMSDLDVLEDLQSIFGGTIVSTKKLKEHHKQCWVWNVHGQVAADTMLAILPYMKARRTEKIVQVLDRWNQKVYANELVREHGDAAARAYLDGEGSLREVARRFDTSYETVRRHVGSIM